MLIEKGIKISRVALSERYRKEITSDESSEKDQPQTQPKRKDSHPKRRNLPVEVENLTKQIEQLTGENETLKQRLTFLEDLVKSVIGDRIPKPKLDNSTKAKPVSKHNYKANCPVCGKVSRVLKSRTEGRFYCKNPKCKRNTFCSKAALTITK